MLNGSKSSLLPLYIGVLFEEELAQNEDFDFSSCYIALAAPSMDGKPQFAFTCDRLKPLYFPLSVTQQPRQPIYANFERHTHALRLYAEADLRLFDDTAPSAPELGEAHVTLKLF